MQELGRQQQIAFLDQLQPVGNEIADRTFPLAIRIAAAETARSEEHTSELQSLMRISYAVFCLKKKNKQKIHRKSTKIINTKSITHTITRMDEQFTEILDTK